MEYKVTVISYGTDKTLYEGTHNTDSFSFGTSANKETDWKELHIEMVQCHPSFDFERIHYTCWVKLQEPYVDIITRLNSTGTLLFMELKKTTLTKDEIDATMQPIEVN